MDSVRQRTSEFRRRSTLGMAATGLVLLAPFAVNNFLQGRPVLGVGAVAILLVMAILALSAVRGRYHAGVTFFSLTPPILIYLALVFEVQGIIGAIWSYPASLAFYCALEERPARVANAALLAVALPFAWWNLDHGIAMRVGAALTAVAVLGAVFVRVIMVQQQALEALAATDPLTGLANRLLLDDALTMAVARSRRTESPMSLVMLDIDRFKDINDTHGHDAGDAVLRDLAELLRKRQRQTDRVFRIGGEEFLLLLENTGAEDARGVAEELRASVAGHSFGAGLRITASFGVAELQADDDASAWMKRVDDMQYQAKTAGRNLVRA
ncbi:MAG: GGDEF domain-containing protein [Gammaproteobacteria bacterium]|nr:GGDEF domain-containing protein [Gammaproteobacteria bacterium]